MSIELEATDDILAGLAGKKKDSQVVAGFALESSGGEAAARKKAAEKGCDYMILNMISGNTGFGCDTNEVTIYRKNRKVAETGLVSKADAASAILDILARDPKVRKAAR
jgi:phosphopantothenoylcysteine decarboxylase/phosphopantothenate--cysteine ligase